MEAPRLFQTAAAGLCAWLGLVLSLCDAAEFRTQNFVVTAATPEIAQQVAETAETCRRELALEWLGQTLPNWYRPCPVKVTVGQIGAGGATTFTFDRGEVSGWNMRVQGSLERVLDSVIPHEVSHTIFASHFRRPLPRWADEGAATLIEHPEERKRQDVLLQQVIHTSKRIPLERLLAMSEYPSEMQQVYTLYAEGYSLSNFLVQQHGPQGKAVFLQFIQDAHKHGWKPAIEQHYAFKTVGELEQKWTGWVLAGSPARQRPEGESLAATTRAASPESAAALTVASPLQTADLKVSAVALAELPPLAPPTRVKRQPRTVSLNAPAPALTTMDADGVAVLSLADPSERVVPRVTPFPGNDLAANRRMQQVRNEALAATRRAQQISTARTGDPNSDAVLRAQSPETRHWSEFSAFPSREDLGSASDEGRRAPFGR